MARLNRGKGPIYPQKRHRSARYGGLARTDPLGSRSAAAYEWTPDRKPGAASAFFSESEQLCRAYSSPFFDVCLFAQKTVDFYLNCVDAFLLPFCRRLSAFDKALDQQVLKLRDPGSSPLGLASLCGDR